MEPEFSSDFEGGNGIGFTRLAEGAWSFRLRPDTRSEDRQWFHFRVRGAGGRRLEFHLLDTDRTNVPVHWDAARPVASADGGGSWRHVEGPTAHARNVYTFGHNFESNDEQLAFHFPYNLTMIHGAMERWAEHPAVARELIGSSVEGRAIEVLRVAAGGAPSARRPAAWIVCRQHAGETSASWTLDGLMDFALGGEPAAVTMRRAAVLNVVPVANPDGVVAGNYRNNAAGVNLNRVWHNPEPATSPEVVAITDAIRRWVAAGNRYDWFGDLHSDSEARGHYAFHPATAIRPPRYATPQTYHADARAFLQAVARNAPDFDPDEGASEHNEPDIARVQQMQEHGVMALIFEAGYSRVMWGHHQGHYLGLHHHRQVGQAIGRALAEFLAARAGEAIP